MQRHLLIILFLTLAAVSCKKDKKGTNPYDSWQNDPSGNGNTDKPIDPNTIEGLHKNIFKPTCANSGCHDGTFEPDFRTIESAYNTIVNQKAIKTDPENTQFIYRVVPGNAAASMILHRINHNILNNSGTMPLSTDPDSDWPAKRQQYIDNITKWINDGAKDQLGNPPPAADAVPEAMGMLVFADGSSTALGRNGKYDPVLVPSGAGSLDIWVAYEDDKTAVSNFSVNKINFSKQANTFLPANEKTMTISGTPVSGAGLSGTVNYYHKITIPVSQLGTTGDVIWVRTTVSDNVNAALDIPGQFSMFNLKTHFTLKLQ